MCEETHSKCSLTITCCSWRDTRPIQVEGTYKGYVDGIGNCNTLDRWSNYCLSCKDYYNVKNGRSSINEWDNYRGEKDLDEYIYSLTSVVYRHISSK